MLSYLVSSSPEMEDEHTQSALSLDSGWSLPRTEYGAGMTVHDTPPNVGPKVNKGIDTLLIIQ